MDEDYKRLVRYIKRMERNYDTQLEDLWARINDDTQIQRIDEIEQLANRNRRALARLRKEFENDEGSN